MSRSSGISLSALIFFIGLSILASNISLTKVWGAEGQKFTLFEFLGPLPGAFFGPIYGIAIVLVAKVFALIFSNSPFDFVSFLRFIPAFVGVYIFSKYKNSILNPLICAFSILLFILHPVGSQAWLFSLFWLIPILLHFFPSNNIFLRSLATTLTQHSVGAVIWIYFVSAQTPEFWLALIPVVAIERFVFATGIAFSYLTSLKILDLLNNQIYLRFWKKQLNFSPYIQKNKNKIKDY